MKARIRDFVYTTDDLYFATTNYLHPDNRILSFLRYIPDENGDREKNGKRYSKVDSEQAYDYLNKNHPEYLYFSENTGVEMMGVPLEKVKEIIKPNDRLKEIMEAENEIKKDDLLMKLINLAKLFHNKAGIDYVDLGISGSTLPGLQKIGQSDLDFVVFGLDNHRKAMNLFNDIKDKEEIDPNQWDNPFIDKKNSSNDMMVKIESIRDEYWDKVYHKRLKDSSLSFEEFKWYEKRKNNRGLINGTLFDILVTRNWDEVHEKWGDITYESLEPATIECTITDAISAYDNPASYKIDDVKIIEGEEYNFKEVVSFTHTYAGEVIEGERAIARGKVEKVNIKSKNEEYYRIVVGTTRESINEFIKLKNSPV